MFTIYADGQLIYEPGDRELLVLQPKLTLEMGAAGSLDFRVPPTHPYYDSLKQLTTVITAKLDNAEIFRGRVLSNTRDFNNFRQTYCEGCLSYLVDSVQKGEAYNGTAHSLFRQIISKHNSLVDAAKQFTVGNITVDDKDLKIAGKSTTNEQDPDEYTAEYGRQIYLDSIVDNWSTTLDYINQCLIDYQGGYLMVRRVGSTNYIDWIKEYSSTATQEIEFGVNLLDLTEEISADELFTVLIPIGDENLTIASVNGGSIELVDSTNVAKYGRIVRTEVFSDVNSASTLLENGRNYLANEANVPVTFTIKAVDLSMIDNAVAAIRLGDRVKIKSEPHNLNGYYTCTKIEYDFADPANTVFTFGNPHQTLTRRYRKDKRKETKTNTENISAATAAQEEASDDIMHFHLRDEVEALDEKITDPTTGDTAKKLEEFFDAYIDTLPSQGQIKLRTVYQRLEDAVLVLQQNAGIDIDAPAGTVNIFSTATTAENAEQATAQIKLWAGYDDYNNLTSKILLEADVVSVKGRLEALEGHFSDLTAQRAYVVNNVSAGNFYSRHFYVYTGDDSSEFDLASHKHSLFCDSNGNVSMGLPVAPANAVGFNIADTDYYQAGVSARTASAIRYGTYSDDGSTDYGHVYITSADGNSVYLALPSNGYTAGYSAGFTAATNAISSVRFGTYSDDGSTDYGHIYVTFSDGTSKYLSISPNGYQQGYSAGFTAGQNSVSQRTVSSVSFARYSDDGSYDFGHVNVFLSDGTSSYQSVSPNGYNQGYNAGYNAGYSNGVSDGFSKGGYRTVYLGSNYGAGAYVSGYYYASSNASYMTRKEGSSIFNADYAVLYFY